MTSTTQQRGGLARRSVGVVGLWFFQVSASAPLTVLVGAVVAMYAATGVVGVPVAFLVLTAVLALLTVGYVAMARHLPHAATFYALLAHGLGRPWAVVGAVLALIGYNAIQISLYGLLGASLAGVFGGPWWLWAVFVLVAIGCLGALRIAIGAGVLAVLLALEIGVIVLFDIGAFSHAAAAGTMSLTPLLPDRLAVDGVGGVLALAIASYVGYESGPAYGEEARTQRTVASATFAAVLFLGPFYAVSSWALAVAVGPDQVAAASKADPELPMTVLVQAYGVFGPHIAGLGAVLLVTSIFAAMLSFHSTVARYVFALARERLLPQVLARTGLASRRTVRDAPVGGSLMQTACAAVVVMVFATLNADPIATLFTWLAALAAVAVLLLLVASSLAALRWFHAGGGTNEGVGTRVIAPLLAIVAGTVVLGVTVANLGALLGVPTGSPLTVIIPGVIAVGVLLGLLWAGALRHQRRDVYDGIGRGRPHPLSLPDKRLADVRL